MTDGLPLLDWLRCELGCEYVSDLHFLPSAHRHFLAVRIDSLAPEDVSLKSWNDALAYLTHTTAEQSAQAAKATLMRLLSQ